jgi:hypothetical protein
VTQGREEFFTPRREVAKGKDISKQQRFVGLSSRASISVPNLGGFASVREIAAIKVREEFFSPRREVAKDGGPESAVSGQTATGKER